MDTIRIILYALLSWNIIIFVLYGTDKRKSQKGKYRISEKSLIAPAFFMGSIGAILGMLFFRHKTKHWKFKILLPLSAIFNIAVIVVGYYFANAA